MTQFGLRTCSGPFPLSAVTSSILTPAWESPPPYPWHHKDLGLWGGLWEEGCADTGQGCRLGRWGLGRSLTLGAAMCLVPHLNVPFPIATSTRNVLRTNAKPPRGLCPKAISAPPGDRPQRALGALLPPLPPDSGTRRQGSEPTTPDGSLSSSKRGCAARAPPEAHRGLPRAPL